MTQSNKGTADRPKHVFEGAGIARFDFGCFRNLVLLVKDFEHPVQFNGYRHNAGEPL